MATRTGLLQTVGKAGSQMVSWFSDINMIADVAGWVFGRGTPSTTSTTRTKLMGIFTSEDERQWQILLDELDQKRPGGKAVIERFTKYANTAPGLMGWMWGLGARNAFRTWVLKMDAGNPAQIPAKETHVEVTDPKGGKTVTDTKVRRRVVKPFEKAIAFLEKIVNAAEAKGEPAGFDEILESYALGDVPRLNKDTVATLQKGVDFITQTLPNQIHELSVRARWAARRRIRERKRPPASLETQDGWKSKAWRKRRRSFFGY